MIRYHCDVCSTEIPAGLIETQPTLIGIAHAPNASLEVKVQISRQIGGGAWNGGHICGNCLSSALVSIGSQLEDMQKRGAV